MNPSPTLRQAYQHALWAFVDRGEREPLAQALTSVAQSAHLSPSMRRLGWLGRMILNELPAHAPVADWGQWYARIDRLLARQSAPHPSPESCDNDASQLSERLLHQHLFQTQAPAPTRPLLTETPLDRLPHASLLAPQPRQDSASVWLTVGEDPASSWGLIPSEVCAVMTADGMSPLTDSNRISRSEDDPHASSGGAMPTVAPLGTVMWDGQEAPVVAITEVGEASLEGCIVQLHVPKQVATGFASMGIYLTQLPSWQRPDTPPPLGLDRVALARAINAQGHFASFDSR